MTIAIGSDHAGFCYKEKIKALLEGCNKKVIDVGTHNSNPYDYPKAAKDVCKTILAGKAARGIIVCGTGIGVSITANKFKGIRAALVTDTFSAKSSITHNNANVLCLGERITGWNIVQDIVNTWINTEFDPQLDGGRHLQRVEMIEE